MQPIIYLVRKEFRQVFRDKAMVRIIFVVPMLQLLVLAYAITLDLKDVKLTFLDQDQTAQSRKLVDSYFSTELFKSSGIAANNPGELQEALIQAKTGLAIWIPRGYAQAIARGTQATVSIQVDGTNSSLAGQAAGYANALVQMEAMRLLEEKLLANPTQTAQIHRIELVSRYFYNPELESRYFMVPAIVVLLITIISTMLTGMAVVREKEIGTLEQLMVTPITPIQLIAGKTIPFAVLSFLELTIATTFAVLWFKLPLEGSILVLALAVFAYLLVTLGIGLLTSTISSTQQQAMFTIWFLLVFGILMSGFFFPIDNMPHWAQYMTYMNPLRYIVAIVRGIFLKGATLADIMPNLLPLFGLGLMIFSTAIVRFRKRVG